MKGTAYERCPAEKHIKQSIQQEIQRRQEKGSGRHITMWQEAREWELENRAEAEKGKSYLTKDSVDQRQGTNKEPSEVKPDPWATLHEQWQRNQDEAWNERRREHRYGIEYAGHRLGRWTCENCNRIEDLWTFNPPRCRSCGKAMRSKYEYLRAYNDDKNGDRQDSDEDDTGPRLLQ